MSPQRTVLMFSSGNPKREVRTLPNGRLLVRPIAKKRRPLGERIEEALGRACRWSTLWPVLLILWFFFAIVIPLIHHALHHLGGF